MAWVLTPALLLLAVRPWSQYLISPCLDFIPKMRDNNSIYHLRSLCRLNGITQIKWLAQFYITVNTYAFYLPCKWYTISIFQMRKLRSSGPRPPSWYIRELWLEARSVWFWGHCSPVPPCSLDQCCLLTASGWGSLLGWWCFPSVLCPFSGCETSEHQPWRWEMKQSFITSLEAVMKFYPVIT